MTGAKAQAVWQAAAGLVQTEGLEPPPFDLRWRSTAA